ncbi:MAG: CARDB domain-containing protein, partial [Salibacteraceae bacterium]
MTFFPPKISTGVCSLLFVLVLWCLSCSQLLAQRIVPFNPITGDTIPSGQPLPSFVQFRIDGLAPPRPLEGNANFPDWTYYWTFGDCKSPSLSRQPIHQYDPFDPQQTAFQVKCVLTGIYSDDDDLITFYYPSETGQFALLPVPEIHPEPAQPLLRTGRLAGIVPVRETSPEQLITYLLPYGNSNFFGEAQGQVTLEYPFEILIPANDIPESCGFTNKSFSNLGNYEAVVFDFDQLLPNETRFIPVNFRVNEGAPIGQEFDLYVDYWDDQGGTSRDTLRITLVDSQDPNEKRVDRSDACPGDRLEYTIHFENFGNGPAAQVTIIDEIDTVLQLHQFLVEGHSLADTTPLECIDSIAIDANFNPNQLPLAPGPKIFVLKDSARSKVAWVLQNIDLPPIDSAGNTGMVRYSIPLKPSAPTNWHPFGKNAAIYFDDNTPIMTQAPICVSKPCLCTPSPQNNSPYYITKVELNGEVQVSESDDGYRRFINQGWSLRQALKNEITGQFLTPQGNTRPIFWRVWLDGNRDGDFSFNELVLEQEGANITNDFLLPNNPGTGMATLRIAVQLNSYPNPCSLIHPGEIEDYEVVIEDPGLPDLRPLVAQLTAPVLIPGQLNTLVGICTNLGPASATNPTLDYYLSDDPDYDTTDLLLASTSVNLLAQGDTLPDTVQAFIPTGYQGTYYLLSIADQNNGLNENQENNNQSHRQIRVGPLLPDLTIGSAFVCEPQIRDNTSLSVAFQVRNIGATAVPAASGATAEVLVSSNP